MSPPWVPPIVVLGIYGFSWLCFIALPALWRRR